MIAAAIVGLVVGCMIMWMVDQLPDCPKVVISSRCCNHKSS
jgi:hypothetical protein